MPHELHLPEPALDTKLCICIQMELSQAEHCKATSLLSCITLTCSSWMRMTSQLKPHVCPYKLNCHMGSMQRLQLPACHLHPGKNV